MRLNPDSSWTLSPTDLSTFVRCAHAIQLRKKSRDGSLVQLAPPGTSIRSEMLARRGGEHENDYLDSIRSLGKSIVEIPHDRDTAIPLTRQAMHDGVDVIAQAALAGADWFGYADLLERVETPSKLGSWSYEVADAKLSQSVHPYFILQIGIYSDLVAQFQGTAPHSMHLILGDGSRHRFTCRDYSAYLKHIRSRFMRNFESGAYTLPYPVDFCGLCEWNRHCWKHLVQLDHLSLVAGIRRDHIKVLDAAGVTTLEALGQSQPQLSTREIPGPILERLHHQARLQLEHRQTGKHRYEFLEPEERRGFQLLPIPSAGDLFFDVEADPFEDLTYLFGMSFVGNGVQIYKSWWAHDAEEERRAFEDVVDFIIERRKQYPDAHIYHYGPADVSTLKNLMGRYGTREEDIDNLLRQDAFVDFLAVVRQSIRISHPSYSLKKVETFYFGRESEGVIDAGGAILAYENWLQDRDPARLKEIEDYNREDCDSIVALRSWLIRLRGELEAERGITLAWREQRPPEPTKADLEQEKMETDDLTRTLLSLLPEDRSTWNSEDAGRRILANLLHYHRREDKPEWWAFFERLQMSPEELIDEKQSIGELVPTGETRVIKQSVATEFRFEPQQHKFEVGDSASDPYRMNESGWPETAGTIESIDNDEGRIVIKRKSGFTPDTLPRAIISHDTVNTKIIRAALRRIARSVVDRGFHATRYRAGRDILLRALPRIAQHPSGTALHGPHIDEATVKSLAARLDDSYLFIQGPPGSGKTYHGARIIIDLLRRGKRVGVTATSHKAIENMLHKVEEVALEQNFHFRGLKVSSGKTHIFSSNLTSPRIVDIEGKFDRGQKPIPTDTDIRLIGGTAWLFSNDVHEQQFDYLVIDEAGQMSLADAVASSTAARNIILLGDPLQLAQVSQGTHPAGCGASVLEHLLGDDATIPPDRGVFLEQTRRMHPDVCGFISDVVYDSRLESHSSCAARKVSAPGLTGTGLRFSPVIHEGNSQKSVEEARWIAQTIESMLNGGRLIGFDPSPRQLLPEDFLVVTPYNAQVSTIRSALARLGLDVPVGTVDKFQGQEAPVIFFSMATSSGEDIPRSLDFLFSRNRLNVAISRAQCLAILVASPALLDVACRTVDQMKLVNALCRFVEVAENCG